MAGNKKSAIVHNEIKEFWKFKSNNKDELVINISKVIDFLSYNNIYCYYKDKDTSYIVKEVNNVIEIISEKTILKYLQDYVNSLPSDYKYFNNANCNKEAVQDLLKELSVQQFNKIIQNLEIKEIELLKDTKDVCYKCFKNIIVKITANNIELLDYKDIDKKVLKTNIIDYEFTINKDFEKAMAYQFHKNVTTTKDIFGNLIEDKQRFLALRSALGYLMHNYKNEIDTKAIVLCEEQISDNGGRTGKTLTCKMLEKVGCNLAKINGRKVDFNNRFLFQNVNTDTNIIQFDDTDIKFDFSGLYSIITNGITIEKKNKQAIQFTHQDTPKFVITTNQVLTDESNSGKDRKFEIEFSDYYNDEITPRIEFGCMFFTDWDEAEWNLFFNYMIDNIQLYIKSGLIDYNKKNLKNRKLMIAFDDDKISNFCTNICIEILTEKKNLSSQEILDRYKKTDDSIANNPKINIFNISKTLNKFIAIQGLKAIKNTTFYEGGKQQRGFVYVNRYANSVGVLEFLKDNNIEIDTNDVNSINFDTNDIKTDTNEVNEATNEIQTEGKIEFTNTDVNDTNVNVNSINNEVNRNIDIEKDKAIPSLEEMVLNANDWDLPF